MAGWQQAIPSAAAGTSGHLHKLHPSLCCSLGMVLGIWGEHGSSGGEAPNPTPVRGLSGRNTTICALPPTTKAIQYR
jgi:hypothetical protein